MADAQITAFFDGACPLCRQEAKFIKRRDPEGRIKFVDIAAPDFDAGEYGFTQEQVDRSIHAITADGRVLRGMAVFREIYRLLGKPWLVGWTGWPVVRPVADFFYKVFARHIRPNLPGRGCPEGGCSFR
jgi:predicted DCC family thiol-disulfide oxidoreductase YuxK